MVVVSRYNPSKLSLENNTMPSIDCFVTIDPPTNGVLNMAIDDARLQAATADSNGPLRLRFYQWSEPTLTLGYFQRLADRDQHKASLQYPLIRRSSGGGAILHDHELTYSLTVPAGHSVAHNPTNLYSIMHSSLIAALQQLQSWHASPALPCQIGPSKPPFLCFQRYTEFDVLMSNQCSSSRSSDQNAVKICGSAQRRRSGAVLQHGSVLLQQSNAAPELLGIKELTGVSLTAKRLIGAWQEQLNLLHHWHLEPEQEGDWLSEDEVKKGQVRYTARAWTARR